MPLFVAPGQKLTRTNWTFRNVTVPLCDKNQVIDQLRKIQELLNTNMMPLCLSATGGVLKSRFRYALASFGRPEYIEYSCLNEDGTPALFLNGIVGFPSQDISKGIVFMKSSEAELYGECFFRRHDATMNIVSINGSLECIWSEAQGRKEPDTGQVLRPNGAEPYEVCRIQGQSKNQELGGRILKHELFADSRSLGFVYPQGSWRGGIKALANRFFYNTINLFEYTPELPDMLSRSGSQGKDILFSGLATSLALHRPLEPFVDT